MRSLLLNFDNVIFKRREEKNHWNKRVVFFLKIARETMSHIEIFCNSKPWLIILDCQLIFQ